MNCIENCSLAEKLDQDSAFLWKCLMGRRGHGWWLSKKSRDFCWENKKFFNTNTSNWTKCQLCTAFTKNMFFFYILNGNLKRGLRALKTLSFICSGQWKVEKGLLVMFSVERRNFNGQFFRFLWPTKISSKISNTPQKTKGSKSVNVLLDRIENNLH